jgi:hypothetical protein
MTRLLVKQKMNSKRALPKIVTNGAHSYIDIKNMNRGKWIDRIDRICIYR